MKTVLEILNLSTTFLQKKGFSQPRRQAEELISEMLRMKRLNLYLEFDRPLDENEIERCRSALARRVKGEPLQYIQGEVEFLECRFKVSSAVLIPRQETEILADRISKELTDLPLENKILWDLCCGSGCLGIALKKRFPMLKVFLSDLSASALEVAKENAKLNQVDVEFREGDLLLPFRGEHAHFIVCNPPYLTEQEWEEASSEVRAFEPKMALVGGTSGVDFYEKLAHELKSFLQPKGRVWLEIGYRQGPAVKRIFSEEGWSHFSVEKDWAGHDRFFSLENE